MKKLFITLSLLFFYLNNQAQSDSWEAKASFAGAGRSGGVAINIGSNGYLGLGQTVSIEKDWWTFDPSNNTWTQLADFGGNPRINAAAFSIGAKGYVGTGSDGIINHNDLYEYDPSNNTWVQKANMLSVARTQAVAFSVNGKGYVGTGFNIGSGGTLDDFEEYDPILDSWTSIASFPGGPRTLAVGIAIGSKGYVGTGLNASALNDFYEYDPSINTWTAKASFPGQARYDASGFAVNGLAYVGLGQDLIPNYPSDFYSYDPGSNSWLAISDFPAVGRTGAPGFSIASKGFLGTGSDGSIFLTDFWEYSPAETGDYRSVAGLFGWNNPLAWEVFDGTSWIPASFAPDGTNSGVITIRNGYNISNNSQNISGDQIVIQNGGALFISEGTLTVLDGAGDDLVCFGALNLNTGTIVNDGVVEIPTDGDFSWGGDSHVGGTGTYNVRALNGFNISSPAFLESGCVFHNYTTCSWSDSGELRILDGSVFNNHGTFNIDNDGDIRSTTSDGIFNNLAGSILENSGTGVSIFFSGFTFNNYGTVIIDQGTIQIDGSNGVNPGYYQIEPGAALTGNEWTFTGDSIVNNGTIAFDAFDMSGTSAQIIGGNGEITNLHIFNPSGITLTGNQTITANLLFDNGVIHTGNNSFLIGETTAVLGASGTSYIDGNLQRYFGNSGTLPFFVGDQTQYLQIDLNPTISTPGYILVRTDAGDHPAVATSGIDATKSVNRHWTITDVGTNFSTAEAFLNWAPGDLDGIADPFNFSAAIYNNPNWLPLTVNSTDNLSISISGIQSSGDVEIGEALPLVPPTTHYVEENGLNGAFTTIGDAITASVSGDTILVYPRAGGLSYPETISSGDPGLGFLVFNTAVNGEKFSITGDVVLQSGWKIYNAKLTNGSVYNNSLTDDTMIVQDCAVYGTMQLSSAPGVPILERDSVFQTGSGTAITTGRGVIRACYVFADGDGINIANATNTDEQ
ncbi:MAG: hypothetical protein KA281_11015, partial [Bacteroidia bacterium]|nr:hypothetical protein [Bacteroidia bacterium]